MSSFAKLHVKPARNSVPLVNTIPWQHPSNNKPCSDSGPTAAYQQSENGEEHLQQIERLEKQLFAKSDGWRGPMFQQELSKRNTFCLYAVRRPHGHVHATQEPACDTAAAVILPVRQQPHHGPEHLQPQQAGSVVLGYIVVQVNSVTAHINKVAVAPHARRQGLAAALLKAALQIAIHERRALCSTLHTDVNNTAALGLYKKAGFEQDGLIHDYYGAGKNAYKLLADLKDSSAVGAFVHCRTL